MLFWSEYVAHKDSTVEHQNKGFRQLSTPENSLDSSQSDSSEAEPFHEVTHGELIIGLTANGKHFRSLTLRKTGILICVQLHVDEIALKRRAFLGTFLQIAKW